MPRYQARAEFRRLTRHDRWVLAGVWVGGSFRAAAPDVEPVRARLPDVGLVGWAAIETPIVAPALDAAGAAALEVARARWPDRARGAVPYPAGLPDPALGGTSDGD